MARYNCAALYRYPDRIEVWFDAVGLPGIKRVFPPDQVDLPSVGTLYEETDIIPAAAPNPPASASGIGRLRSALKGGDDEAA